MSFCEAISNQLHQLYLLGHEHQRHLDRLRCANGEQKTTEQMLDVGDLNNISNKFIEDIIETIKGGIMIEAKLNSDTHNLMVDKIYCKIIDKIIDRL